MSPVPANPLRGNVDLSFLAGPQQVADWRQTLLWDVAARLGILAGLPGTPAEVAGRTGLDAHAVRVLLEALGGLGMVSSAGSAYTLTENGDDGAAAATVAHHARAVRRWATELEPRLRGDPGTTAAGTADPDLFHDALAASARLTAPRAVDRCLERFPHARSVLDVGGLHGEYALEFARRGLRATMQDLPPMIEVARRRGRLAAAGVQLFEGSFFEVVPDGPFDLVFCCGVTHTFDGDHNLALFRQLRRVVSPDGGVCVLTFLRGSHPVATLFAVQMLLNGNGGDTHTEEEYRSWLGTSGFTVDPAVGTLPAEPARSVLFAV